MRASKSKINEEAKEIYFAIVQIMQEMECEHCMSWWIRNFELKSKLDTPQINHRCKLLIKMGVLSLDNKKISGKKYGNRYKLTGKSYLTEERKEKLKKLKEM